MTKSTITREQLLEIIETDHVQCGEASYLARMALAAMDSEPVAWMHNNNDIGIPAITTSQKIGQHWMAEFKDVQPLYRHAQPAPVVPDDVLKALQKVARIRLDMDGFDGDRRGIADCLCDAEEELIEVVNRRAAMLQAAPVCTCPSGDGSLRWPCPVHPGNYPAIPDGYVMVPDDLKEAAADLLATLDDYPEQLVPINRDSAVVRALRAAMLAAAPQEE